MRSGTYGLRSGTYGAAPAKEAQKPKEANKSVSFSKEAPAVGEAASEKVPTCSTLLPPLPKWCHSPLCSASMGGY